MSAAGHALRPLGSTGLLVSPLCLGSMQFGWTASAAAAHAVLSAAWEAGLNFVDTADIYPYWAPGNPVGLAESTIGSWLRASGVPRDRLVIASKVRGPMGGGPDEQGLSRAHVRRAVEGSLYRLGTDYLDLYLAHWPDDATPIEETLRAFDELVAQGKVRALGCSNYPAWKLVEAVWTSRHLGLAEWAVVQPRYSLAERGGYEAELQEVAARYGLGVLAYSPLAAGFLTGKYRRGEPLPESARRPHVERYLNAAGWELSEGVAALAEKAPGVTPSQVALAWVLAQPEISAAIVGPRNVEQLADHLEALDLELETEDLEELERLSG